MKKLLILLFIPFISLGQEYSNYYGTYDVNVNANINKKVNVSGNINKTITTIDYGALANANATRERNRIESLKIANERDKDAMIAIANDPSKAFDYGIDNNWKVNRKFAKSLGFKKFTFYHKIPHNSLFTRINNGYNYQNISGNRVETIIQLFGAYSFKYVIKKNPNKFLLSIKKIGLEETMRMEDIEVGKINNAPSLDINNGFIHKKELNRATVFGLSGYVSTVIFEDDYERVIIDYYNSKSGDFQSGARVTFKGDKDEVTFEDLEGRRYYFNKLIERTIGSAQYIDIK